jgi:hypothetical protein
MTKIKINTKHDVQALRAAYPECAVTKGWHLAGPGPARHGWAAVYPSGAVRFLGPTAYEAMQKLASARRYSVERRPRGLP